MPTTKFLNKKEIKKILTLIKQQYDADVNLDYIFLKNQEDKIFIVSKDLAKINLDELRINRVGIYIAKLEKQGIRLTIEGSQLIGKEAKKNILEIDESQVKSWLNGNDLTTNEKLNSFVIIKHKNDFLGSGYYKEGRILNYTPKERRIKI